MRRVCIFYGGVPYSGPLRYFQGVQATVGTTILKLSIDPNICAGCTSATPAGNQDTDILEHETEVSCPQGVVHAKSSSHANRVSRCPLESVLWCSHCAQLSPLSCKSKPSDKVSAQLVYVPYRSHLGGEGGEPETLELHGEIYLGGHLFFASNIHILRI